MKIFFLIMFISNIVCAIEIVSKPISFSKQRIDLTIEYIKDRYNLNVTSIKIVPKMIVIHHTDEKSLEKSFKRLDDELLESDLKYLENASNLNVSAHYLIDQNGTIYSLMNDNHMARHVIGLNYSAIGIENVGGDKEYNQLTLKQLESNIKLVEYLKNKYNTIEYLIGHYEYKNFENHPLFLEKDIKYRTVKSDPSVEFMNQLRKNFKDLKSY